MAVSINLGEMDDMKRLTNDSSSRVQIVAAAHKTLSHLPQRPAVDLAFVNLNYKVREGRSNSKYTCTGDNERYDIVEWFVVCNVGTCFLRELEKISLDLFGW